MDLVKIGFIVTADGIKNANNQVDQLLTKVEKVGNTPINIKAKIDSSITSAQKTLKDFSKFKNNVTVNISANGNAIKNLQNQLSRLKDRTIRLNVKTSSQEIGKLNQSLNALTNKKVNIEIKITPSLQVLQDYNKELDKMRSGSRTTTINTPRPPSEGSGGRSSSNFDQAIGIAKYAVLSAAIYGAMTATLNLIKATVTLADEYTATQQRLKLYIKDSETLGQVNTFLAKSAIQNNVGLRENAALYAKLSPAMQRIGANTAATNQVVDAFGKSLRIGGATAMEAASATIQFAQAMASGKLAGDEFRAISEASPRFLKAIADGSGIAAEKLKEMSSAGALTTEVIARALVKEYHNLTRESESLGYTLEQGTNALKTGFMSLIGEFNEGAGITKYLGTLMADMGVSMIDSAKSAKESGEAFRVWSISNADNISNLVEAFKLLSTVIISRYVAALILARFESMKTAIGLVSIQIAAASAGRSITFLSGAISLAGMAMKGMLTFFGGWVGLALTVAGTVASYVLFNKESEKTTESLRKEGETIEETVAKYKELTAVQRDKALLDERKNVEATTKAYQDKKSALVANVLNMSRSNDMTNLQAQTLSKLGLWYKEGKINLEQLNGAIKNSTFLSQESKDKFTNLASGVSEADQKATAAEKVLQALGLATKNAGDEADIAGSKFDKFLQDTENVTKINVAAAGYMRKYGLDQAKAVELAKQDLALRQQGKYATLGHVKALQEQQASEETLSDITKSRTKADKEAAKSRKDAAKDLKKFNDQLLESQTYYDVLKKTNNLEVARIAGQKEYINIYKGNLAVATQIADIQERTRQAESRIEFEKSLRVEEEANTRIVALIKQGADYETAKAVANAKFTDDLRGREAAELSITNTLTAQAYALSDQITEQEILNKYLKEGMGIEEARFKVALSRIAKLSGDKNVYNEFGEDYENAMKTFRVRKATESSEIKINAILRESGILIKAMELGYTASNIAVAKLSGATQGLLFSQAETQLKQQEELDLLYENAKTRVKINSLLSGESETLRAVKDDYATIGDEEAKRIAQSRQALEIAEAYAAKMKEQKANPLGDFSKVDFEVFGSFGNPFKEALDGLNALISGSTKLDESLAIIATQISDLKTQSFVEDMFGNQTAVENLNSQVEKQVALEKDLQKQKAETNDVAYGQGLKFAKSFFKEGSKGYKVISGLEMALQAKKIAFAIWEKKDTLTKYALEIKGMLSSAATFVTTTANKMAAQMGLNVTLAQGAAASAAQAPPPVGFASAAAMIALMAGIGIAVGGGGSSGSFAPTNEGKGTVFGDTEAKSASVNNSIELLSKNSDLMLPLTSAMLASLKNIESSIGGVTNLVIRNATGSKPVDGVKVGFVQNDIGNSITKGFDTFNKMTFGLVDKLTLGLFSSIGKALGGLFGTKTTIKGQGLFGANQDLGSIVSQGFDLQEYVDIQTKKKALGITTSTKNSTRYSAANKELENQFSLIFTGFYDSIVAASGALSANTDEVKKKLQDAVVSIGKVNLKGLNGEQIQEKLEAVFGAAADKLAQQGFAGLDDFQRVGEGYFETLVRVAASVEQAQYYTDQLNVSVVKYTDVVNKQGDITLELVRQSVLLASTSKDIVGGFDSMVESFSGSASELVSFVKQLRELQISLALTGKDGEYLTQTMIQGAGGLQELSDGFSAYYDMLSAQEQATHLTAQMTEKFRELGKDLPNSIQGYKDILNSQEVVTASGQKLYGQLIALAPEFTDLQSALKRAEDEANALKKEAEDLAEAERKAAEEAAKYAATLSKIRQEMFVTKQSGEYLSEAMIKAAGGTDELSKGLQAYFSMLSPAEQATELTRRMTEQFGALGQTLPSSVDAFRLLIEGLDITTMSGQELYGQLIALTPEFNTLQSSIKAAEDAERNRLEEIARAQQEAAEAAAKAAEEARELAKKWDELRTKMFVTKQSGTKLSQIMIDAAGGLDELSSGLESYFSLLSEQEQVEELTRRLNIEFSKLGLALPNTVEEFRNLVEGMDTNTNAGKMLYGQVIALTPQFKELQDMMKSTGNAISEIDLDKVRIQFEMLGKGTDYLTVLLAKSAGGVDSLSGALDAYFELLTPQEKAIELTRRMTKEFSALGMSVPSSIEGFKGLVESVDISTQSGQELMGKLLLLTSGFVDMQSAIEATKEAAEEAVNSLKQLKLAFEMTGKDSKYLTMSIAEAAGGVDKLSSGLDAYFEMLSPQEKAVELTRRLTAQFNAIGQTLPNSVDGFRNLISSIDVTTASGQKLYGQVIALAPEFNTLQDALSSSANEVNDLVKSLRDLADEARKARGEQDKPQNLNITRWQFEQAAMKAMLGDVDAAQQLLTLGRDLMEISSTYASSSEDYARDLASVQRAATLAADTQANGLSTSTAPTLSPATGTNTTPTVATTNTAMTTEMQTMREEFNAGLFAIAKYVQNLDSRTDRWDDGGRMMVGIQPENGDTPVPVVVTP